MLKHPTYRLTTGLKGLVYDYVAINWDLILIIKEHDFVGGVVSLSTLGSNRSLVQVNFLKLLWERFFFIGNHRKPSCIVKCFSRVLLRFKITLLILGWLCWGLTSQSTIFQSCRDGAIASWVINQYFRGVKCLAKGHNTATVGLEPRPLAPESDTLPLSHRAPPTHFGG